MSGRPPVVGVRVVAVGGVGVEEEEGSCAALRDTSQVVRHPNELEGEQLQPRTRDGASPEIADPPERG